MSTIRIGAFKPRLRTRIKPDAHMGNTPLVQALQDFPASVEPGQRAAVGKIDVKGNYSSLNRQFQIDRFKQAIRPFTGQG